MIIDLDTVGYKHTDDVERVQRVSIQAKPVDGDATGAVLEIKRAFGGVDSPSVSFSPVALVPIDGTTILEICVIDTAWLHFVVTTPAPGVSIDVEILKSGPMVGVVQRETISVDAEGVRSVVAVQNSDRVFVLADPLDANTAEVEIKHSIDPTFEAVSFAPAATLSIDGSSITEICTRPAGVLQAVCTAAQTDQKISIWYYIRNEVMSNPPKDFRLEIAAGRVPNHSLDHKFGRNPSISTGTTPEDIWNGTGIYRGLPIGSLGETVDVVSSDAADSAAGTGARIIELFGLDQDYNEQSELITLDGLAPVTSVKIWVRVNRYILKGSGTGLTNAGVITVSHTTTTANVFIVSPIASGGSKVLVTTVPANKILLLEAANVVVEKTVGGGTEATLTLRTCNAETGEQRTLRHWFAELGKPLDPSFGVPLVIREKTDLWVRVDSVSANNTIVSGDMQFILMPV